MDAVVRVPHAFLRRHLSWMERGLVAAGMGLVLYGLFTSLPAYPNPWEVVIATAAFFVMLWSPPAGYFLAVTAALYPLYTLSLYLAVLFLAIALLGQRVFINNLGATLLVLLAPWLAQFHLEWVALLLGGLWWGKTGGAWMGGLAALWGQLLFGMAGQSPNWLDMMGIAPSTQGLFAQFKDANSLETLKLIVAPLAPNPAQALYHLLQIFLWAMVGGLVGGLSETSWIQQKHPWRAIGVAVIGAAAMAAVNIGLTSWLEQYKSSDLAWIFPGMMESALYAAISVCLLEGTRDFIEHPLPLSMAQAARRPFSPGIQVAPKEPVRVSVLQRLLTRLRGLRQPAAAEPGDKPAQALLPDEPAPTQSSYQPLPVPPNLPHRDPKKQPPDDIIKIELD
jgi:hypothetical protein